jgi:transcriptional regulator with XRE-family HTH domain
MSKNVKQLGLGEYLKTTRDHRKLSLRDVESATSISNAYLSQLEGNKIKQPSPKVLHKLSELYQISYAEVMKLAGYPIPEGSENTSSLQARIGPTTLDEEDSLVEYLEFLRSRRGARGQT